MTLDLKKYGAIKAEKGGVPRNLLIDLRAPTKCGTTRFALQAPKKRGLVFFNFDRPLKEVRELKKLVDGKDVQEIPCQDWSRKNEEQAKSKAVIARVEAACKDALRQRASTVVIDKATDFNEAIKMAIYGKSAKIMKRDYGDLNSFWKNFLHPFKASDTNLILVHHWSEHYLNDKPTGESKSKGWGGVSFECTCSIELSKDRRKEGINKFGLEVTDCTFDTSVEGEELRGKMISFQEVAMMIIPTSSEEDWE